MPGLVLLPALVVIVLFAVSGGSKLFDLRSAPATLRALRITRLPARTTVAAVATIEVVVAAALLLATGPVLVAAAVGALMLSLIFLVVGLRAQARHSTDECGCFGRVASTRVGPMMTARNTALVVVSATVVAGVFATPAPGSLAAQAVGAPFASAALAVTALALAAIGASLSPASASPATPSPVERRATAVGTVPDAALITPEGGVVVPRQRAQRGRAPLLLFVRRGCSSCENLIDRMAWDGEVLESLVDVRLIVPVGDDALLSAADEGMHADPSGGFAVALGIPADRPAGVLLTTAGDLLLPIAVGGDETAALVGSVLAAAIDARSAEGPSTT